MKILAARFGPASECRREDYFFAPSADAASTGDVYEINVELPGVAEEDVTVELPQCPRGEGREASSARKRARRTTSQNVGLGLFIGPSG